MTAYSRIFEVGQAGELADCSMRRIDTEYMDRVDVSEIEFGVAVTRKDVALVQRGIIPWTSSVVAAGNTHRIFGITVYDRTKIEGKYVGATPVNVLTAGRIRVLTQNGVSAGDVAYLEEGTGLFTNVATNLAGDNNTQIGIWMSDTGAIAEPTLAIVSINLDAIIFNN